MRIDTPLIDANIQVLRQGLELIARLDDLTFAGEREAPGRGTTPRAALKVGSHFRHCVDFYRSFLDGLGEGAIDYDRRERDVAVERSRVTAMGRIRAIIAALSRLSVVDTMRAVQVKAEATEGQAEHLNWSQSSVRRELQFLLSHTVHHYALIALAARLQGVEPGAEFGVAPSTLAHWRKTA